MTRLPFRLPVVAVAMAALVACGDTAGGRSGATSGEAQSGDRRAKLTAGAEPRSDAGLATLVAGLNGAEIDAGTQASRKGTHPDVQALAKRLVDEHLRLNLALDTSGVRRDTMAAPPVTVSTMQAASAARSTLLAQIPGGPVYDRAWAAAQVLMHREALDSIRTWREGARSESLRRAMDAAVPVIEGHLRLATALQGALGAGLPPGGAPADSVPPRDTTTRRTP